MSKKPETLEDAEENALMQLGREIGSDLVENAVKTASGPDEMNNQIFITNYAATHILALMIYNRVQQFGDNGTAVLSSIMNQIWNEYEFLKNFEPEKVEPGPSSQGQPPGSGLH